MLKITPVGHRVLVKLSPVEEEEKSEGGIIIASGAPRDARRRATQEATVVKLGANAFKDFSDGEPWCSVGDLVLIAKYSGEDREDKETGDIFRIINDEDIFAIVEE